ncbi:unnamed protein product [Symbiodinium necroappetens]|uniref:Uncharacterized protein n=1 Tax=Symbiodinium necroappetens TaxID=1628268 RepID=A0A812X8I5_9DINO|nr:unnamed protein product [Symbiodinium necroappetens]
MVFWKVWVPWTLLLFLGFWLLWVGSGDGETFQITAVAQAPAQGPTPPPSSPRINGSKRSTAGLFRDPVAVAADQSVQQLAQSQANALDKLGKRINGNLRAKHSLQEAATAWLGKIGQHLAEAIAALQQASVNLEASAQEQVDKALGGMGPIWNQAQEAEVLRLAACLRAFSAVGGGEAAIAGASSTGDAGGPGTSSFAAPGSAMTRSPLGEADGSTLSTPARSSTSGEAMDISNPDLSAKRRWNQRGNRHPRPSKSPRRELDLSAEPWPRVATGLTPDRPQRPRPSADEEELIPAVATPPYTWASAWCHISRHCWELGAEHVGHVATSDPQEQVLPVLHLIADPEQVVTEGERLWEALQQSIQQLESDADTGRFVEQLTLWLEAVRERPLALPSVRQGLLTLAHAVSGNIYSVDGFGPSTAQEWLFPAELLAQEIPLVGLLPTTWDSMALRVLVTMPCPMRRVPEAQPLPLPAISLALDPPSLFSGALPQVASRWRDLRGIAFEGVHGRLDLPQHIDVVQDTVTFRSGDCFRIDTEHDHSAVSEYARLEDVDLETAEASLQPATTDVSSSSRPWPTFAGLLGCLLLSACQSRPWCWTIGVVSSVAMHRPGGFPWPVPPHERVFRLPNIDDHVQVLYYSPFLGIGNFPAYWAAPDTAHSTAWAQFLNDDAAWATDFFPVWPGLHFNALAFVPVGNDRATVTVILHYRGFGRAALMPRTVTDSWLQSFASQQVSADVEDIFLPHALEAWRFYDVPPPDYRLRNGDVIYLRDRVWGRDPLEVEDPWDIQTSGTGQHAPWAIGFRLDSDTVVDILQPGQRPTLATIPAGETWAPVQCTFSGEFHLRYPGMWTPVQWSASSVPQLMLINGVAAEANVVVARAVPRHVGRESLAACTGLVRDSVVLGGVPSASLDAGVEIRNGDVVFGEPAPRSAASPTHLLRWWLLMPLVRGHARALSFALCSLLFYTADAMQQPLAFSFNAYRVGRFPWREDDPETDIATLSSHDTVDTVYLSPFSGPGQVVTLPTTFSVSAWSAALVLQDPDWGATACPVWPTVSAGAMVAVPRPPTRDLVCVHVTSHLEHFALCIPRVTSVAWLVGALRTARVLDVLSLRIPPALGQSSGDSQDEIAWRPGDLIVALPPDAFTGLFQTPVFTRAEQLRHCAIWSLDFCLAAKSDAVVWQPDTRPLLTTVPRGSRWSALDATFEGAFSDRYPGSWAPVPWIAEDRPHLVQIAASDRFVHVVVETPAACFCTAVHMHTDRLQLRADLPSFQGQPRVLSIPDEELQQGTTLRDGDVVIEIPSSSYHLRPMRLGLLGSLFIASSHRWLWFGSLGVIYSLQCQVLPCGASNSDAPSPDSSEARTIRSRLGRGRRRLLRQATPTVEVIRGRLWFLSLLLSHNLPLPLAVAKEVKEDYGLPDWLHYRAPQEALSAASWALPFVLEAGGSARTWIPALSGCLPDLHLISPGAPLAAHVFCVDSRENRYPLVTAHLGGPDATGPPFGWHWHPSIAATSPTRLRDGDVLVVDPTAERIWDPLAGVPPAIALDKLAVSASLLLTGRPLVGLLLLVGLPAVEITGKNP